ncbi:hypothetical protein AK830_g1908 [Neonectria ditissima]|uniref:Uncharacterized protein n=1 Tax=Neonectria ditissima TaxID=78410 RepID=A0A0P7BW05_9HYPO|nr:hypothetical protein AK830_g1908 [Neonectria ditissima]
MAVLPTPTQSIMGRARSAVIDDSNPWTVDPNSMTATALVYALLVFLFGGLFGIMLVDMYRKRRTGELQETGHTLGSLAVLIFKLPVIIFSRKNMSALWIWFTDLFRKEANKKRNKKKDDLTLNRAFDHNAVILRLAAKRTEAMTTTSGSSSPDEKGKDKEVKPAKSGEQDGGEFVVIGLDD